MAQRIEHRRREPAPGVFRLELSLPFEGLDRVNAYVLTDGDAATLVDCGIYFPDGAEDHGWPELVRAIEACDLRVKDIKRLILTHSHIDHYGMAGRVKDETGCDIVMHRAADEELELLRHPEQVAEELRSTYRDHGVTEEDLIELTRYEDWRGFVHSLVDADTWLDGDEGLEVDTRTWRVVHTPGHARSHVCLWSEQDGLLISGDHLLPTITPHIDFRRGEGDPLGDFLESLGKVEGLAPEIVLPGHGRPFADGAERARVTARHHERRLGAILQVVRRNACTADQITEEIFGGTLLDFRRRLALGEALAHIHYLRLRGEIERIEQDGRYLYKKVSRRPVTEVEE